MKKEIYLDAQVLTSEAEFHEHISKILELPPYYGHNLDDLWEFLTNYIDKDIKIYIQGYSHLQKIMGTRKTALDDIFSRLESTCPEMEVFLNN
ncbi:MAG: barstar family protein [Bacteriovoracaceae bacterium]|jgi:ribonuclease inhibitor|nr:barstar family protein [Bacteriovoracaceae bacterium]